MRLSSNSSPPNGGCTQTTIRFAGALWSRPKTEMVQATPHFWIIDHGLFAVILDVELQILSKNSATIRKNCFRISFMPGMETYNRM